MSLPPPPTCDVELAPNAPDRMRREAPFWQTLRASDRVRAKFAYYTPEDVREIDCPDTLRKIYKLYACPASQPHSPEEWAYCSLMASALFARIIVL